MPRRASSRRRKKSKCGNVVCFHGAFKSKSDAERKAAGRKGAFVKNIRVRAGDYRYLVMTQKKRR
jgi:hypothetical protein